MIWTHGSKIEAVWVEKGSSSMGARFNDTFMNENTAREIEKLAEDRWAGRSFVCCKCGKVVEGKCAGSHFAGEYCLNCWVDYKAQNSGNCLICGVPRWKCCC